MKSRSQVFALLIALLTVAVLSLEASELATLTNDVSNDPAPIESAQEQILRSVTFAQPSTESLNRLTAGSLSGRDSTFPCVPSLVTAVKAGARLLYLLVVQRK